MARRKKWPFLGFYVDDYIHDTRILSLPARAIWMDMLCLMHKSVRRGYLCSPSGIPLSVEQIANFCGCSSEVVSQATQELLSSGVASASATGMFYSRRMVRDESKREKCSQAGKDGGGNPTFKGHSKGHAKVSAKVPLEYGVSNVKEGGSKGEGRPPPGVGDDIPGHNLDMLPTVRDVIQHYQAAVRPAHATSATASRHVIRRLHEGIAIDVLKRCADGYAASCAENGRKPRYRCSVTSFYDDAGTYLEFLEWTPPQKGQGSEDWLKKPWSAHG